MKNKILTLILLLILIFESYSISFAASSSELSGNLNDKNNEINNKKDELNQNHEKLNDALAEVQTLQSQINGYEDEISDLKNKIGDCNGQIKEKESNIALKEKEFQETNDLFEKRLVAIYRTGDMSYLELMLSAQDLSDFISKYYLVSELAKCDTKLIESIRNSQTELEKEKQELENVKSTLEESKEKVESKQKALAATKKDKDAKAKNLSEADKALKAELDDLQEESREIQRAIEAAKKREEEENKNKGNGGSNGGGITKPSACGYIFPVRGCTKRNIRTLAYPSYPGHTGVDANINVRGKDIVAVKDGYVLISKAKGGKIKSYDSNGNVAGSYSSYGEYVVIMHNDGTQTLYAHMMPGSRKVSVGQKVKQGQTIGKVGNTGNVKPRPSPSNPAAGTHLHFEVRINGRPVNPVPYLP